MQKKRKRGTSPGAVAHVNMDADYDPRIPNDFAQFKGLLRMRRHMKREKERRDRAGDGYESYEDEEDEEAEQNQSAAPSSYREYGLV